MRYAQSHTRYRQRVMAQEWGDAFTPPCACGCGEPVPFSGEGPATKAYVNRAHLNWCLSTKPRKPSGEIPMAVFKAMVLELRDAKRTTLRRLSVAGGRSPSWLGSRIFSAEHKAIKRATVEDFLDRVAESWQQREVA